MCNSMPSPSGIHTPPPPTFVFALASRAGHKSHNPPHKVRVNPLRVRENPSPAAVCGETRFTREASDCVVPTSRHKGVREAVVRAQQGAQSAQRPQHDAGRHPKPTAHAFALDRRVLVHYTPRHCTNEIYLGLPARRRQKRDALFLAQHLGQQPLEQTQSK